MPLLFPQSGGAVAKSPSVAVLGDDEPTPAIEGLDADARKPNDGRVIAVLEPFG
jgi:hypothetical protein